MEPVTALALSDFTIETFLRYLRNEDGYPQIVASAGPYGQVQSLAFDAAFSVSADVTIVWTRPEAVIPAFAALLDGGETTPGIVLPEVDAFAAAVRALSEKARHLIVVSWCLDLRRYAGGMLANHPQKGYLPLLARMNLRLMDALGGLANVHFVDAARWVTRSGEGAFNPKAWYLSKVPFGNGVFQAAAREVKASIRALLGKSKKLVILDLDDTLWGGILGDVGVEGLCLGGHDPLGESFGDFQRALKALRSRGVLLAVVSKNDEPAAIEAIDAHPEMVLRTTDFAAWRINWRDKAQNIVDLVAELNIGLEDVVFIDDSAVERGRVREALPMVSVPEWPTDKLLYRTTLVDLPYFDTPAVSDEDVRRTQMYRAEHARREDAETVSSLEEWIAGLKVVVTAQPIDVSNVSRAVQLLNKTNQMNLRTRRMDTSEYLQWSKDPQRQAWAFAVRDRFGEYGLTGLFAFEHHGRQGVVLDFVLSCRVVGRGVEERVLEFAASQAAELGLDKLCLNLEPTAKNGPMREFLLGSTRLQQAGDNAFELPAVDSHTVTA